MTELKSKVSNKKKNLSKLQKLSLWSYHNPRKTALIWLVVVLFGATCYTTLLKREGFPSINTPLSLVTGSYFVNDPAKIDNTVAAPLSTVALKNSGVKSIQTQSFGNFYSAAITYKDNVDSRIAGNEIKDTLTSQSSLPKPATLNISPLQFGFTSRGDDLVISYYSKNPSISTQDTTKEAEDAATYIKNKHLSLVRDVSVINPFESAKDPFSGKTISSQRTFDIFGFRNGDRNIFHKSVVIGVQAYKGSDNIMLDKQVEGVLNDLNKQPQFAGFTGAVSGTFAGQIKQQINELQKTLLEGLLAILIVGSIVIAIRASLVTVISMFTVIATVNGLLYLVGYSLNTITLFALILSLSLIVDDTIIMIEAIDAQRRKQTDPSHAVEEANRRVSKAMISATTTAALSFAPLIFVGGILGSFIRAIPLTIIAALITSLTVALVFIPFFSRYLLLNKKQMGDQNVHEYSAGIEAAIAKFISGPMLWAKGSTKKLFSVGIIALIIGFGFIAVGGVIFQKVTFNIFPSSKDGNQLTTNMTFKPNTTIDQAQQIASDVNKIVSSSTGSNFIQSSYFGQADVKSAAQTINIIDYNQRKITAPQLVAAMNTKFKNFNEATVKAGQNDAGPPAADFAIQIEAGHNRVGATNLARSIDDYISNATDMTRPNGRKIKFDTVAISNTSIYTRNNGQQFVAVNVKFLDTDTTTLVNLTKNAVKKHFPESKVASFGVPKNAISFNAGQEDQNQNSFKTLAIAFPVLLLVIYLVLSFQFRSLLQPGLIFMAIPFSFFGITLGLYLTNNAFSFFAMLGFFALIGLSLKNTILLTDYANQSRKAGLHPVDAAHEALAERFRPLIATSLTAVFSLIPLALSSPFWQGLSVVLIFGLLSSTFLVITVFPYYYLGAEFLRIHINRKTGLAWLVLTFILIFALSKASPVLAIAAPLLSILIIKLLKQIPSSYISS